MTKPQPEILDFAQLAIRRHDAAAAMLAALKNASSLLEQYRTTQGERDYAVGKAQIAIAQAEAAGIK